MRYKGVYVTRTCYPDEEDIRLTRQAFVLRILQGHLVEREILHFADKFFTVCHFKKSQSQTLIIYHNSHKNLVIELPSNMLTQA